MYNATDYLVHDVLHSYNQLIFLGHGAKVIQKEKDCLFNNPATTATKV